MKSMRRKAIVRILIITIVNCIIVLSVPLSMNLLWLERAVTTNDTSDTPHPYR